MAGFAVSLLWLTSLVACQTYIYGTLPPYPLDDAINSTNFAGAQIEVLKNNYVM